MTQEKIRVYCYGLNTKGYPIPLFTADDQLNPHERDHFQRWRELVHNIHLPDFCELSRDQFPQWITDIDGYQKSIVLLFSLMKHLADPQVYQQLPQSEIRNISNKHAHPGTDTPPISNFNFQPVITIGKQDIMKLYEEPEESSKDFREFPAPDPRFKFFDCSIWHSYIPMLKDLELSNTPLRTADLSDFFERIEKKIQLLCRYHDENLYATNAARSTLELQLRLLKESFIERFGNRGHYKAVTPFKFHAESRMAEKADELINDFYNGFLRNIKRDVRVKWRFLMVDDYANSPISVFLPDQQISCKWTKRELILQLLKEVKGGIEIDYPKAKDSDEPRERDELNQKETGDTSAKTNIINTSLQYLAEENYDIILLDYLLGRIDDTEYREFGHQFLQYLNQDAREDGRYKRGPYGRFWIFPISSFPFAMHDKLKQLGISNFNPWWHLANGCDPISTPQMFRYSLLIFLKHQISEVLLQPRELEYMIGKFSYTFDEKLWTKILAAQINEVLLKIELLKASQLTSPFAKSMIRKLSSKYAKRLYAIKNLAEAFQAEVNFNAKEEYFNLIYVPWVKLKQHFGQNGYQVVIDRIEKEFERLGVFIHLRQAEKIITANISNHNPTLKLNGKSLIVLPEKISWARHITSLELRNNQLENLPDLLKELPHLTHLDLSGNPLRIIPPVLYELSALSFLSLERTGLDLQISIAKTREEVHKMLREAKHLDFNKHISTIKTHLKEAGSMTEAIKMLSGIPSVSLSSDEKRYLNEQNARIENLRQRSAEGKIGPELLLREETSIRQKLFDFLYSLECKA